MRDLAGPRRGPALRSPSPTPSGGPRRPLSRQPRAPLPARPALPSSDAGAPFTPMRLRRGGAPALLQEGVSLVSSPETSEENQIPPSRPGGAAGRPGPALGTAGRRRGPEGTLGPGQHVTLPRWVPSSPAAPVSGRAAVEPRRRSGSGGKRRNLGLHLGASPGWVRGRRRLRKGGAGQIGRARGVGPSTLVWKRREAGRKVLAWKNLLPAWSPPCKWAPCP